MNGQIYSFGDISMVRDALNAVGMIFNSPTYQGGSLIILAFLIGLIFMVLPAVGGGKANYTAFLGALLLYFAGIAPKMSLTIEDYYTGQLAQADHIPLIVGMPASIASSISYELGQIIETAMSTPTTTKTFSQGGFVDPLKIIFALRDQSVRKADPLWSASFLSYLKDCAQHSPNWNPKAAQTSKDLIGDITGVGFFVSGITLWYPSSTPISVLCNDAKTKLIAARQATAPILTAAAALAILKANDADRQAAFGGGLQEIADAYSVVSTRPAGSLVPPTPKPPTNSSKPCSPPPPSPRPPPA